MKQIKFLFFLIIITFYSCSKDSDDQHLIDEPICNISNVVPKGNRIVGIDLLNLTETNAFDDNLILVDELGMEFIALHVTWSSIEPSPNNYVDPGSALEILGQVASANNLKFSLTIRPIDLTGKTVPTDLENTRFNNIEMIGRFKSIVDFIFTKIDPAIVLNFQIGNEIDGYDTSREPDTFWDDYGVFLREITAYIHATNPNLKTGFTGTYDGLMAQQTRFNNLLQNVDILGVTYYPLNFDFSVREPNTVFNDFENLVVAYSNAPIYLQEVGYQTSPTNGSDESKQAEFFCNVFKAWDIHSDKIKSIEIVRLNDLSIGEAEVSAGPYGVSGDEFVEYLRTLGIRTYDNNGTNKQAFDVIKSNLLERGW